MLPVPGQWPNLDHRVERDWAVDVREDVVADRLVAYVQALGVDDEEHEIVEGGVEGALDLPYLVVVAGGVDEALFGQCAAAGGHRVRRARRVGGLPVRTLGDVEDLHVRAASRGSVVRAERTVRTRGSDALDSSQTPRMAPIL